MTGYSYSDEIAMSFERVESCLRRGRTQAAAAELDHCRKLVSAELGALLEEVRDAEKAMVREDTDRENERIANVDRSQRTAWEKRDGLCR